MLKNTSNWNFCCRKFPQNFYRAELSLPGTAGEDILSNYWAVKCRIYQIYKELELSKLLVFVNKVYCSVPFCEKWLRILCSAFLKFLSEKKPANKFSRPHIFLAIFLWDRAEYGKYGQKQCLEKMPARDRSNRGKIWEISFFGTSWLIDCTSYQSCLSFSHEEF
jgi:hypothetical protein